MAIDTFPQMIPAEFTEKLAMSLLLQPDPMYIFARMAYAARAAAALRALDSDGFDLAALQMAEGRLVKGAGESSNIVAAMASGVGGPLDLSAGLTFPGLISIVREAKMPGESILINRPGYINGVTTEASRLASSSTVMFGATSQALSMEQVSLKIVEFLGPTNAAGALAPISLPRFTQQRSAHDLLPMVTVQLRRDRNRFLDDIVMTKIIAAITAETGGITRPSGMTSNATYTAADNEPMSFDLLVQAGKAMKDRSIPGVNGEARFPCILSTNQVAQLKLDPQYQRLAAFEPKYNPLFPGYMTTVGDMLIIESNRMPTIAAQGVGSDVTLYQGLVLAPGIFGWGSAEDARPLKETNDDGGRSNRFAWSAYEGFGILDSRFGQLIVTD